MNYVLCLTEKNKVKFNRPEQLWLHEDPVHLFDILIASCYEIPALRYTELILGTWFEENYFWENGPFNKMKATDWAHVSPLNL